MSNQWVSFATEKKEMDSANESISGGKYIGLGTHQLRIDGIEGGVTKTGKPFVKISYSNEAGQTLVDRLYPIYSPQDGSGDQQSFKYKNLAHAILPEDGVLRFEFFTSNQGILPLNPELWPGLVGLTVMAEVSEGKSGYTFEVSEGVHRLVDIKTKEEIKLSGGIPNQFEDYKAGNEAAKAQGLYRAWNEISKFSAAPEFVETNQQVIKKLIEDTAPEDEEKSL